MSTVAVVTETSPTSQAAGAKAPWVWIAVLVAAAVVVPRTWLISQAHSSYWDDQYHLRHGLAFLSGQTKNVRFNDPPLGEAIVALPAWLMGCRPHTAEPTWNPRAVKGDAENPLFDQPVSPETILRLTAVWKALLFLPAAAVVFVWAWELYGLGAAWLALVMMLFEPTIAGHIAPASLDVLAMEGALVACYTGWKYFRSPSRGRLLVAGIACAVAMMVKHVNVFIPLILLLYAMLMELQTSWRVRVNRFWGLMLVAVVAIWALTLFDFSEPKRYTELFPARYSEHWGLASDVLNPILEHRWPGGIYIGSLFEALSHGREGHEAFLLGSFGKGWWYYLPAVAVYKVPIGVALIMLIALASFTWRKPQREELAVIIAAVILGAFLMSSKLSIGFRHAMPVYGFLIILASRAANAGKTARALAWLGAIAAGVHGLAFHPNYITYVNFPRADIQFQIGDSNVDWGQGLKDVRKWLDAHPTDRPVRVAPFSDAFSCGPRWYLGPDVDIRVIGDAAPTSGILIVSPVALVGVYDRARPYRFLWDVKPVDVIGNSMLVYDLDRRDKRAQMR